MQDLETRGERQAVAGVHHKMLPRPQQLAVNMELLEQTKNANSSFSVLIEKYL